MLKENSTVNYPGILYVIAAPSGAGKTSLVKALSEVLPHLTVSISHTTRPKRSNEIHGVNYFFVSKTEFQDLIVQDEFLEHAIIFGELYGTAKTVVKDTLAKGIDVILEIDWQGHQQIKKLFPNAVSIFILPPSLDDLEKRLLLRNQDKPEIIKDRLMDAKETLSHIPEFNYLVINDDFNKALHDLKVIIEATRLTCNRQLMVHAKLLNLFFNK